MRGLEKRACQIGTLAAALLLAAAAEAGPGVTGRVLDPSGSAAPNAHVRVQASDDVIIAGPDGSFSLAAPLHTVKLTAALPGYRIGSILLAPGDDDVTVHLKPLPPADDHAYVWDSPQSCSQCHPFLHQEWASSQHALAAADPVALALYRGTRWDGSPSAGFGYRKAHPESYGDCAFCHAPAFAARTSNPDDPLEPHHDLDRALSEGTPAEASGVTCDFCNKVRSVALDDRPPRPGRKLELLRPPQFEPLMFGPFDDVTFVGMGASWSPLFERSDVCALCHWEANEHGAAVGSTYREWLDSPYPGQGKRCETCHLEPTGDSQTFCFWEPVMRNPARIATHGFHGTDSKHLGEALGVEVDATRADGPGGVVAATVTVTNTGAGHAVPTGVSLRQVLLLVEARRASGFPLDLIDGPRLPEWAGEGGPPGEGYLAGLTGRGYARITTDGVLLRVFDTEATGFASDSRLPPLGSDISHYRFSLGSYTGRVEVRARLVYRPYWKDLEVERGFPRADAPMAETAAVLQGGAPLFIRGDADASGALDISDAVATLGHLFTGAPQVLPCPDAADTDDSGAIDITDAVKVLAYLFLGGPPPASPFPEPGPDTTPGGPGC